MPNPEVRISYKWDGICLRRGCDTPSRPGLWCKEHATAARREGMLKQQRLREEIRAENERWIKTCLEQKHSL